MTVFYFFRRPVTKNIQLALKNKYPKDFFYGYANLASKHRLMVSDDSENNKFITFCHNIVNTFFLKYLATGVSLVPVLFQLSQLKHSAILFATVDSYGLALAILKKFGLLKNKKIIFNTIGLCDVLNENSYNKRLLKTYHNILSCVDLFISGASNSECKLMAKLLDFSSNRFTFIPFGIDTQYFTPLPRPEEDYVLIIGADKKRDWSLYQKIFQSFSKISFLVITHPGNITFKTPSNVRILYNIPIDKIREAIARCKFLVILSKENYHFAGQSTAFRAMSMAKTVIFTRSQGVDEYNFINGRQCLLVDPGDYKQLTRAMKMIMKNTALRTAIGISARKKIKNDLSIEKYSSMLHKVLTKI